MRFYKYGNEDIFILEDDGKGLAMRREEAEELFVMIGHVLQDDDVERYSKESMDEQCH